MLKSLFIQNYALIDTLDIRFEPGFSVITGETGAGKSIILGAIGLLLGGATAAGFVLQPLLAAVCDRSRLTVRLTLLTGGGLMLLCCAGNGANGRN